MPHAAAAAVAAAAEEEPTLRDQDVLFGRGGKANKHPGNVYYLNHVRLHRDEYRAASRGEKAQIAQRIVQDICSGEKPRRFLKKADDGSTHRVWQAVGQKEATDKVKQALRGAPSNQSLTGEHRAQKEAKLAAKASKGYAGQKVLKGKPVKQLQQPAIVPREEDVLLGKRTECFKNVPGNVRYRGMIDIYRREFATRLQREEKVRISRIIVSAICLGARPGRFLHRDEKGRWRELSDEEAMWRTFQELLEKKVLSEPAGESPTEAPAEALVELPVEEEGAEKNEGATAVNIVPTDEDVLFGGGEVAASHPGNVRYRDLISAHRQDYCDAVWHQKGNIAQRIVKSILYGQKPGRFLCMDIIDGKWHEISPKDAGRKTSEVLRNNFNVNFLKKRYQAKRPVGRPRKSESKEKAGTKRKASDEGEKGVVTTKKSKRAKQKASSEEDPAEPPTLAGEIFEPGQLTSEELCIQICVYLSRHLTSKGHLKNGTIEGAATSFGRSSSNIRGIWERKKDAIRHPDKYDLNLKRKTPPGRQPKSTPAQIKEMTKLSGAGQSIRAIADQMGVSRGAVWRSLKAQNEKGRRTGRPRSGGGQKKPKKCQG